MLKVLDAGHLYQLLELDGRQYTDPMFYPLLGFVKRCEPPEKFPGNKNSYPGTTMQSVLRCICDRLRYLQNQVWSPENVVVLFLIQLAIWLLEFRAARRHGKTYFHGLTFAEKAPMCPVCGHTDCKHL